MLDVAVLQGVLRPIINDELLRFPFVMQAFIGTQMERAGLKERIAPSTSTKLAINTGTLFRSFARGSLGNIYKVTEVNGNFELQYGSILPYARIQEYGGFIATKGKMEGYFWARYRETGVAYFRNIAIKVRRVGGVQIPARPYFRPAVQRFRQDNKYADGVRSAVIKGIQQWQESQRRSNQ
jgi:hypothetical protein